MRASLIIPVLGSLLGAAVLSQTSCGSDDDHGDEEPIDCATETRADNIVSGLEKTGSRGALTFRQTAGGLEIDLPADRPVAFVPAFRIRGAGLV